MRDEKKEGKGQEGRQEEGNMVVDTWAEAQEHARTAELGKMCRLSKQ